MSYAVVRVQKMTRGSVRGIQIHDRREKSESHTNPDIDRTRTEQNYDLCPDRHADFYRAVNKRIGQLDLKRAVRKDAVVMAQVLVTSDQAFFEGQDPKAFFRESYEFLAERYGRENVISATVHMDETTPHMHFNFVPVTKDGRLSAKSLLTRESLTEQQTAFHEQVGKRFGLERGEQRNSGKRRTHFETAEYKDYAAALHEVEEKTLQVSQKAVEATKEVKGMEDTLKALEGRKTALEGQIEVLERRQLAYHEVTEIKPEKGLLGTVKGVTVQDIENLKATAIKGIETGFTLRKVSDELERMKRLVPSLQDRLKQSSEKARLLDIEKAFQRLPEEKQKELLQPKKGKHREHER